MDPSMNHRHTQVHAADLHRRAELHRLTAEVRATRREETAANPSVLTLTSPLQRVGVLMGRVGRRIRHPIAATNGRAT
jgi:hypothetical protein